MLAAEPRVKERASKSNLLLVEASDEARGSASTNRTAKQFREALASLHNILSKAAAEERGSSFDRSEGTEANEVSVLTNE